MQIKFIGKDAALMRIAAQAIQAAAKEESKHTKKRKAAKEVATRLMLELRQINLDALPNKSVIVIECDGVPTLKIERKESQRFDGTTFSLVHPALHEEFTRATPATYFDSLLP